MKQACRYTTRLSAFMDNELPGPQLDEVRQHLSVCSECREELERLQSASGFLLDIGAVAPSPDFDARFQEKLAEAAPAGTRPMRMISGEMAPAKGLIRLREMLFSSWRPYAMGTAAAIGILAVMIFKPTGVSLGPEEMILAENLEILQEYEILSELDLLENWEVIENMTSGS